ncbi:MAG: lipid-A-disaccharide synthase [Desulfobulbaceae bacterium]|uniref:Lipid-A-disaccharide synthase n=1 Tax=Candidatus Desulfatifera sulfidica TaxID=2841691 RepID=A0A8J6NBL8_9BACT|nr:lipid-A-disaccharide synthase [Candidatus Desulfatifera sulfidica]
MKKVMIIAGEASGDLHGAHLVRAMHAQNPDLSFSGMGGEELAAAGVDLLFDAEKIAVVGLFEVFSHFPDLLAAQKILRRWMAGERPDLLILIDFPDFNLMLARRAKKLGIPVFYYISPQVWAWRSGRVKTMAQLVDRIGVILPFEEDFYQKRGVEAHYVGHPLLDSVKVTKDRGQFCQEHGIDPERKLVCLLPGSRRREIASLLPDFLDAAFRMQSKVETPLTFLLPVAPTISDDELQVHGLKDYGDRLDIQVIRRNRYNLMAACDCALAASGTVTLELALLDVPMVVTYRVSPHTYLLGRCLIADIKHFSLVNLIADDALVPELLQDEVNPRRIEKELGRLLFDEQNAQTIRHGLALVRKRLGDAGASVRAANLALELLSTD